MRRGSILSQRWDGNRYAEDAFSQSNAAESWRCGWHLCESIDQGQDVPDVNQLDRTLRGYRNNLPGTSGAEYDVAAPTRRTCTLGCPETTEEREIANARGGFTWKFARALSAPRGLRRKPDAVDPALWLGEPGLGNQA